MQAFIYLAVVAAALFQGAVASPADTPTSFPGHKVCSSLTTVTTSVPPIGHCDFVCLKPSSTCKPGEPTQAPFSSFTTPLPSCTEQVRVVETCGCPTCVLPAPTAVATTA
ncbi:hypothetical protein F4809DRAFT_646563 [Biscogniauxia mediterranea]|nr:hypothetical protein F4809DRAFT_646563 [Biscogniauxia mediterranea]